MTSATRFWRRRRSNRHSRVLFTFSGLQRQIYDLKKNNQELEKFKFVLDFQIKELKNQIDPRETAIEKKKEQ